MTVIDNVPAEEILERLDQLGVSRKIRVRVSFVDREAPPETPKKGRWAAVAERFHKESPLLGISEEVMKNTREFRDSFEFKHDSE